MRRIFVVLVASIGLAMSALPARAQNYEDSVGFYVELAIAMGWANMQSSLVSPVPPERGTMVGLSFTGGYRLSSWLALDAEFVWIGGGDVIDRTLGPNFGVKLGDSSLQVITANAKVYPLAFSPDLIPQWVQPYGVLGVGSGLAQISPTAFGRTTFGVGNVNVFVGRFGVGVDLQLSQSWGAYLDGSYYAASDDVFSGTGTFRLGMLWSF